MEGPGLVLLLGATGSGKSTLLRSCTGLPPVGDRWRQGAFETTPEEGRVGYVPQDALDAFLSFDAEHEFILRARAAGMTRTDASAYAVSQLKLLGLEKRAATPIHRLSAGERRRLALAAVQTHAPGLVLLDEPFNHLDTDWRLRFARAIREAAGDRLVMAATHDPGPLLDAARRVLVLDQGRVVHDGNANTLRAREADFPALRVSDVRLGPALQPRTGDPIVRLAAVTHSVEGQNVLKDVTASFGPGLYGILGANGSGKTTLLRLLAGLETPTSGTIEVDGADPRARNAADACRRITFQFDDPTAAFFAQDVRTEVAFQPTNQRRTGCDVNAVAREALFDAALDAMADRHPLTLSGGERERLALACANAARTPVVLLDEPAQGLDVDGRRLLRGMLHRWSSTACVMVATHDAEVAAWAPTRYRLAGGMLQRQDEVGVRTL